MKKYIFIMILMIVAGLTTILLINKSPQIIVSSNDIRPNQILTESAYLSEFLGNFNGVFMQSVDPCSRFRPRDMCNANHIGARVCGSNTYGACGCSCVNSGSSTNPRYKWLCGPCKSGKCDSQNRKCELVGNTNLDIDG